MLCTMGWHALQHGPIIGALGREAWRLMSDFVISAFPPRGAACPRGRPMDAVEKTLDPLFAGAPF